MTLNMMNYIFRLTGPVKKTFWSAMLVATVALLLFNISVISMHFFRYPVTVNIKLLHESELTFPAVTVCNMNPVRKSAWETALVEESGISGTVSTGSGKRRKKRALSGESVDNSWLSCALHSTLS